MSNLKQAPGYETYDDDINGLIVTDSWFGPWSEVKGGNHGFVKGAECPYDKSLCLAKISVKPSAGNLGYVTLVYQPTDSVTIGVDTNKPKYMLQMNEVQQSCKLLPNYRKNWDCYLAIRKGLTAPSFWETDDNTTDSTSGDRKNYQWVEELSSVDTEAIGQEWTHINKTKPGKEIYTVHVPVVSVRLVFSQFAKAKAASKKAGKRGAPAETFGYDDGEWLIGGGNIDTTERGKWYVDMTYTWAKSVDHDYYESA